MKHIAFTLLFCLLAGMVQGQAQNIYENYIEVHGSAEKTVTPDRITLSITIRETDYKNLPLTALEKDMKNALSKEGILIEKDLKVADMSSTFLRFRTNRQDARLSKSYSLVVKDAATAARCIGALEEVGISNVTVEKAEYSGMNALKLSLKGEAVKNAREIAVAMTEAIGQKIGPAIYMYEQESYNDYFQPRVMMFGAKSAMADTEEADALPELEFEESKVTCRVTVRFALPQ